MDEISKKEACMVYVEDLVTAISEAAWCSETKNVDAKYLYRIYTDDAGNVTGKEVRDEWASVFWSLRSAYSELVNSYKVNPEEIV